MGTSISNVGVYVRSHVLRLICGIASYTIFSCFSLFYNSKYEVVYQSRVGNGFVYYGARVQGLYEHDGFLINYYLGLDPHRVAKLYDEGRVRFLYSSDHVSTHASNYLHTIKQYYLFNVMSTIGPRVAGALVGAICFFVRAFPSLLLPTGFYLLFFMFFLFNAMYEGRFFCSEVNVRSKRRAYRSS